MAQGLSDNVNIFAPEKDILDRAVEGYEENVPLAGQIAAGFTPPGMAMDVVAAGKYGRDAVRNIAEGEYGKGALYGGIAGLSLLGSIPLFGELARIPKGLLKGMDVSKADEMVDIKNINRPKDVEGNVIKSEKKRVDQATELLNKSASGSTYKGVQQNKRQPIEVLKNTDGTFTQLGGKSTLEALEASGVKRIPVKIFDNAQDYNTYDFIRKNNKNITRQNDANKLLPTKGNPTFEGPVREFGNKTEQQFKLSFNKHQEGISSAPQMFERAKRLNPEFQQQVSKLADDLGVDQGFNPVGGKVTGEIDELTGFPVGEVKLMPRMIEKVNQKYNGDFSQITDPIRTRIVVETPEQEKLIAKRIADMFPTVDGERVLMKKSGYLDRKLNVQFTGANGETIIGEIGIVTRPMLDGATEAHEIYEVFRKTNFGLPDGTDVRKIAEEGLRLEKRMKDIFEPKGRLIDPRFYEDIIERFNKGGYVSAGSSGRLSPITPNMFSNSDFDNLEPSTKKSFTWSGVASLHPPSSSRTGSINPLLLSASTVTTTDGDRSQEKYSVSIPQSLQENAQTYNNDIFIELEEADYE